jgi:tetratricopeptide (TPR) repeat protein
MRIRTAAALLYCLLAVSSAAPLALAQELPQECQEAQELRSPQAQVDLLTICLNTGRLAADVKATTYKQRAIAYMHLGRHPRAIDDINAAMKLKSGDADMYYLRGFAYRVIGDHRQAISDSNQAVGLDPSFAAAYANRAFAHKALGNDSQARNDAQRALALDPKVKVPRF